jgi:hypothetical protein
VEDLLRSGGVPVTMLGAGIIVGRGGISWEMTRQLVEHLPVMITPQWVRTRYRRSSLRVSLTQTHPRWSRPATVAEQNLIPIGSWAAHSCGHTAQARSGRSAVLGSTRRYVSSVVGMLFDLCLLCPFRRSNAPGSCGLAGTADRKTGIGVALTVHWPGEAGP